MARTAQTPRTPTGQQASVAAIEQAAANAKPVFDWAALPAPVAMASKTTTGNIKVDVVKTVPEPIRQRAEASLAINAKRVAAKADSTAKRNRVNYHWDLQAVPDAEMGALFVKLITKYAKYRPSDTDIPHAHEDAPKGQVTARTGDVTHYRAVADGEYVACDKDAEGATLGVRFSVRPFEQRSDTGRLPGTA